MCLGHHTLSFISASVWYSQSWILGLKSELFPWGTESTPSSPRSCRSEHSVLGTLDSACRTLGSIGFQLGRLPTWRPQEVDARLVGATACACGKLILGLSWRCSLCSQLQEGCVRAEPWSPASEHGASDLPTSTSCLAVWGGGCISQFFSLAHGMS